jgi:hypothetical protein
VEVFVATASTSKTQGEEQVLLVWSNGNSALRSEQAELVAIFCNGGGRMSADELLLIQALYNSNNNNKNRRNNSRDNDHQQMVARKP